MDLPLETSASLDARFLNRNSVNQKNPGVFTVEFLVAKTVVSNDLVKRLG